MRNLLERPLFPKIMNPAELDDLKANISLMDGYSGKRLFMFEGQPYNVDYDLIVAHVKSLVEALHTESDDNRVTVGRIFTLQSVFSKAVKEGGKGIDVHPLSSFATLLAHPSMNWPVPEAMPGVAYVLGDTGAGKTFFLRHAKAIDFIVRFGEPFEDIDLDPISIPSHSFFNAFTSAIILSILGYRVAVDSLRSLVYGLSGNPMEGGMVAALFDVCTQVNNLVADLGCSIIMSINPMLSDPTKADRLYTRIGAAAAGAIHIVDHEEKASTFRLINGRTSSNLSQGLKVDSGTKDPHAADFEHQEGVGTMVPMDRVRENPQPTRTAVAYGAGTLSVDSDEKPRPSFTFDL